MNALVLANAGWAENVHRKQLRRKTVTTWSNGCSWES